MKSLIALSLLLCIASAFEIRGPRNIQREPLRSMEQKAVVSPRIVNGQTAAANEFSYQAGLMVNNGEILFFCGGSLISNEWVLTAAHCTLSAVKVTIYLGSTTYLNSTVSLEVDKCDIIIHPLFDMRTLSNDISLLKIPAVTYSDAIKPVTLPNCALHHPLCVDQNVVASGWGRRTSDADVSYSPVLKFANFKVISNDVCAGVYWNMVRIDSGKMCTVSVNRKGVCAGDSGGPLVLASSNLQIGIISFYSNNGCEADEPAGYTRVTSYLYWIRRKTGLRL
ncbi:collagenase-like [Eurosta solidaginis]|uniref:collagenase-like n=1 Tax=Eurosta solidaginis TaxID=178769 RepID=UPI0035314DBE